MTDDHDYVPESSEPGCFPPTAVWGGHSYLKERSLPLGLWHVMANGRIYHFDITSVSASGEVTGVLNGRPIEDGHWDGSAVAGVLTFVRNETPVIVQKFTGYLMAYVEHDYQWRMAGVFGKLSEDPPEYVDQAGWYATLARQGR
jgi:hypothetical protein